MNSSKIIWSLLKSWGDKISYTINMQRSLSFFVRSQTQCKVSVSSPLFLYKIVNNMMELPSIHFNSHCPHCPHCLIKEIGHSALLQTWPSRQYVPLHCTLLLQPLNASVKITTKQPCNWTTCQSARFLCPKCKHFWSFLLFYFSTTFLKENWCTKSDIFLVSVA